jgi:hypothetical protein
LGHGAKRLSLNREVRRRYLSQRQPFHSCNGSSSSSSGIIVIAFSGVKAQAII